MGSIQINTHLSQSDFIRYNFITFYGKGYIKFLTGFGVLALLLPLVMYLTGFTIETSSGSAITAPLLIGFTFVIFLPAVVFWGARQNYRSSKGIHEAIAYTFTDTGILVVGQSFQSTLNWEEVHKVVETKRWFLIHQHSLAEFILPLSSFNSEQVGQFRKLIQTLPSEKQFLLAK